MGWWQETYEELGGITAEEWLKREYPHRANRELAEELEKLKTIGARAFETDLSQG